MHGHLRLDTDNVSLSKVFITHLQPERFPLRSEALTTCQEACVAHFGKRRRILTCWQGQHSFFTTIDRLLLTILMKLVNHHVSQVLGLLCTQESLWPSTPRLLHISGQTLPSDPKSPSGFPRCTVQYRPASGPRKPPCSHHLTQRRRRHVHVTRRERLRHGRATVK